MPPVGESGREYIKDKKRKGEKKTPPHIHSRSHEYHMYTLSVTSVTRTTLILMLNFKFLALILFKHHKFFF
ncbi:hypothetical protein RhiirA1_421478 [Rhizophagus irregularis]|uniref:Uncharacterized protein n=1 Tax=Rhizophagus irregularis TaxID=588596 RepID=A0A2N0RMM7_9GLOM|nr:hypothetical protein RhiirA1_421478 [Rhizophagus irregularis]GET65382.1 hypothetical protein RIR_jg5418.t1 [Rhizophagus irregularis DAOM 181602=DAOM 197198]